MSAVENIRVIDYLIAHRDLSRYDRRRPGPGRLAPGSLFEKAMAADILVLGMAIPAPGEKTSVATQVIERLDGISHRSTTPASTPTTAALAGSRWSLVPRMAPSTAR